MFFTKRCPSGGTEYVSFELFLGILWGPGEGRGGAPSTVPLQNPEVTSRKACLRNTDPRFSGRPTQRTLPYSKYCGTRIRSILLPPVCLVAHDCGYPLSRYTCRATRVAADFLDFIAFCRCSTGVALHPLKFWCRTSPPPPVPGGVAPKFGSEKVSRYTGVSQLQLRVSRYTLGGS